MTYVNPAVSTLAGGSQVALRLEVLSSLLVEIRRHAKQFNAQDNVLFSGMNLVESSDCLQLHKNTQLHRKLEMPTDCSQNE